VGKLLKSVKISSTGSYTPENIVTNKELEGKVETSDKWIFENLGIKERRIASPGQFTSDLAVEAALRAIAGSEIKVEDIDLIIVATTTPDRPAPSTACIVQEKIGAYNAAAFDVSAVCSGFIYGFSIGSQFIATGMYTNVLVIGADTFSRLTDWTRRDCVFFGDGAGAVILSSCDDGDGLISFHLGADGKGKDSWTVLAGGSELPASHETVDKGLHYFNMNGREVFDSATQVIPKAIEIALKNAGLTINDVDYLVPHQPSINILKVSAEKLGLPFEKVMTNMEKYANTSGGTVPIILDETLKSGKIKKNDIVVLAAVGSGWTYGAAVIKWI
jgi:3-oxoacyl-[acyl-carrier-protein] synthase III